MADVNNSVQGRLLGLWVSTDGGTTFKEVVCSTDVGVDASADVSELTTRCGVLKSKGATSWEITGSGAANTDPDNDELSADDLADIMQGDDNVIVRIQDNTTPANYFRQGTGLMTAYSESAGATDTVAFDLTISISGDLTLVPES